MNELYFSFFSRYSDTAERAAAMPRLPGGDAGVGGGRVAGFLPAARRGRNGLLEELGQAGA